MSLPVAEGRALAAAIARRPVTIRTEGVANSPYLYNLKFFQRNQIPARADLTVGSHNLAEVDSSAHMDKPGVRWGYLSAIRGDYRQDFGYPYYTDIHGRGQATRTEYVGPVADDVLWRRGNTPVYIEGAPANRAWARASTAGSPSPSGRGSAVRRGLRVVRRLPDGQLAPVRTHPAQQLGRDHGKPGHVPPRRRTGVPVAEQLKLFRGFSQWRAGEARDSSRDLGGNRALASRLPWSCAATATRVVW
jgi:hypothetical protein